MSVERPHHASLVEIVATILLSLAAVSTAWCGYQATRWNGEQAKTAAAASASRFQAARSADVASFQTEVDVATFVAWSGAYARQDQRLADFYRARFREEFAPAVDAWLATAPLQTPGAPLTPFTMPEYELEAAAAATRLDRQAEALGAQARTYLQRGSNCVLAVVLLSISLFFGGISAKLPSPALRTAAVSFGCLVFLCTMAWVLSFPISLSV